MSLDKDNATDHGIFYWESWQCSICENIYVDDSGKKEAELCYKKCSKRKG